MENETQYNQGTKKKGSHTLPLAIIAAAVIIGGAIIYTDMSGKKTEAASDSATGQKQIAVDINKVKTAGEPYVGDPNAPVTIAFWSDYQCPYCKAFETGGVPQIPTLAAMPQIVKNYVKTGKVKIVFKDFAFLGQDSAAAAVYGRAIWELYPDKYFAWREAMFKAQDAENSGFGDEASIVTLTKTIDGIDTEKVSALATQKGADYQKIMNDDVTEAQSFGITGTPGFIIGKEVIAGAYPYSKFSQVIDAELGK